MDKTVQLTEIRRLIDEFRKADARGKRKPARAAAYLATQVDKAGHELSPEEFDVLIEALAIGARHHGWPESWRACQSKLRWRKRVAANIPEPVTLFEKAGTLDVEMGAVMVIDAQRALTEDHPALGTREYKSARENGDFFDVALGMDGLLKVRLRYVECMEPELPASEMKRLLGATDRAFLRAESKRLRAWGGGQNAVEIDVGSDALLASFYLLRPARSPELVCVCCDARGARTGFFESSIELY